MSEPDPLREPGFLTEHQLRAVEPHADIFLTACPGSGKTRATGVRVARLADEGKRVAACSYTNVGVEQIRRVLATDLGRSLDSRQFIGTLHGFLLRFVLYPFGHLATSSTRSLRLIGDDAGWDDVLFGNARTRLPVSRFRFQPDGSLCVRSVPMKFPLSKEDAAATGQTYALRLKREAAARGIVSFDDAMYWALEVLRKCPEIAAAVAARFDEIVVDEAQDTSELQLACLHALHETGRLTSLVLVGDLEQSISAYTGASRSGCQGLAEARALAPVDFVENHRSSQKICDVAVHFCDRSEADTAVGDDAACPWDPEIILYPKGQPGSAAERFRERLDELGEDVAQAAVLARNNALVDELNGRAVPVEVRPRPLAVGRAVSALRGGGALGRRDLEAVDRVIAFCAADIADLSLLDRSQRWRVRQASMDLLRGAPGLGIDCRSWIQGTAQVLGTAVGTLVDEPRHKPGQVLASNARQSAHSAKDVFTPVQHELRAQTVHDIKGESRSSVLVVVDHRRSSRRTAQSTLWSSPLRGETVSEGEAEELRIAFVALTRARRYCAIALPNSDPAAVDAFEAAGFKRYG